MTNEVRACRRCPRLVAHLAAQRLLFPAHHNQPVPAWGAANGRLLIVGLAPGARGANRTGRGFVGDASADFLFAALHHHGLASAPSAAAARLYNTRITNVVKCLPPANTPKAVEVSNCRSHLLAELGRFWRPGVRRPRVLLALGGVAYKALWRALPDLIAELPTVPRFAHASEAQLAPNLTLLASFHPSPLNTQTGRLTPAMLGSVLRRAQEILRV